MIAKLIDGIIIGLFGYPGWVWADACSAPVVGLQ
jgi:hypothetical protein